MSKKISFVWAMVAAMLLSLPANAQVQKKLVRNANKQKSEMRSLEKGLKVKAADVANAQKQLITKAVEENDPAVVEFVAKWDWAAHTPAPFVSTQKQLVSMDAKKVQIKNPKSRTGAPALNAPRYAAENVLVTPPAGAEVEAYTLTLYGSTGNSTISMETGKSVVFDGNDVYVQGLAYYFPDAYVKGTLNAEGQYVFESGQYVGEDEYGPEWIVGCDVDADNYLIYAPNFVFDFDAESRSLSLAGYYGESGEPDDAYLYDYFIIADYTPGAPEIPELVTVPAGATIETWYATGINDDGEDIPSTAKVAFVDSDVYLSGIFSTFPNAWIKGTLEGTTVSFPTVQYIGAYASYNMYAYAASLDEFAGTYVPLDAVTFTYDAMAKTLTMDPDQVLAANAAKDRLYYLEYIKEVFLSANAPVVEPNTVPFTADFSKQADFKKYTVIDNNGDGNTWQWSASRYAHYTYSFTNDADDYLVVPVEVEAGKNYSVTVSASCYMASYPEKFEVKAGKVGTPEGLTQTVISETTLTNTAFMDFDGSFTTDEAGTWYVAIHATSDADKFYLLVAGMSIELGAEPTAPAAPVIAVSPFPMGAAGTTVTVKAPAKAINGDALTSNITKIDVLRDNEIVKTFENVAPGATKVFVDEDMADGTHTYQAIPYNESGIGAKSEPVSVWVGQDLPADIENVQVTGMTANSVSLSWDAVQALNGGYIDADEALYSVTTIEFEEFWGFTFPVEGETIGTVTGQTTATVDYDIDGGEARYDYFGVKVAVGENESDPTSWVAYALAGAPYKLPIIETFTNSSLHYVWDYNENTLLGVSEDGSDDAIALALTGYEDGEVTFETFKLDVKSAANATIVFDAKKGTSEADQLVVYGILPDGTTTDIETITLTDEYQTYKVVVPAALKAERWARLGFKATVEAGTNVLIDNIKILDLYEYDLSISVSAPKTVVAGSKATIKATVKNEGENDATGYTVVIKAGEEELLNTTATESIKMFETAEFTAEYEASIFADAADVAITATVIYTNDLNPDNDKAETLIAVKESTATPVTDVTATAGDKSVLVGWTAPDLGEASTEEITDDVESYEEFDTGGLGEDNLDEHYGQIGEWTVYDGNREYGYGFNGITVPHLGEPNAWVVMNVSSSQLSQDLSEAQPAYSGQQYFISTCVAESEPIADTDHWLISPELPGTAQHISFMARELTDQYGEESFQIWYSTTDNKIESFQQYEYGFGLVVLNTWDKFEYDLPEGTKYFAIRHTSNDIFGLCIDDIQFTAGAAPLEIDHFNIYLDGELAADAAADAATATLENVAEGTHTVGVSVVYTNGQESKPVTATVTVSTATGVNAITVITKPVDVYSVDGKLVRKQTTSVDGLKGVYIVDGKKVVLQ